MRTTREIEAVRTPRLERKTRCGETKIGSLKFHEAGRSVKVPSPSGLHGRRETTTPAGPALVGTLIDVNAYGNP